MAFLAAILLLIATLSFLWLVVEGFKQHVLWGIGILFVPLVWLVFVIMRWEHAKKPFLINLVSSILLVVIMFNPMMTLVMEAGEMGQQLQRGEITQEEIDRRMEQRLIEIFTGKESTTVIDDDDLMTPEEREIATLSEELRIKNEQAAASVEYADQLEAQRQKEAIEADPQLEKVRVFNPVSISEANKFIGQKFRIVTENGVEKQGILINGGFDRMIFERKLAGGNFKFEVLNRDIRQLEVEQWEMR